MKNQTVFIKRFPSKGELPSKEGLYHTNIGRVSFNKTFDWIDHHNYTCPCPNYWLEEIELPSEEEIQEVMDNLEENDNNSANDEWLAGANFILNHIKGENK